MANLNETPELSAEDLFAQQITEAGFGDKPQEVETVVEEPVAEVVAEVAAEPVPATETPVETKAEVAAAEEYFAGYANLPEESKQLVRDSMEKAAKVAEFQQRAGKAEADLRSTAGKMAPIQREYEKARLRLQEIEQKQQTISRVGTRDKLEKLRENYPDEGDAFLAINNDFETFAEKSEREKAELVERLNALEERYDLQVAHHESISKREAEVSSLQREHPDYLEIDADPSFKAWLEAAGTDTVDLLRNGKASSTAFVLSNFKRDRDYARLLSGAAATPNTPAPTPLARSVVDPNPTTRRATAIPRSTPASLEGEDKYAAQIEEARAAGFEL